MAGKWKPIRTNSDYADALADFEGLSAVIHAFEKKRRPIGSIQAIRLRMEQRGLSRKDLEPFIGTRTRVSEVLNGKRNLSIGMIRRLNQGLGISAEVLIRAPRKKNASQD